MRGLEKWLTINQANKTKNKIHNKNREINNKRKEINNKNNKKIMMNRWQISKARVRANLKNLIMACKKLSQNNK